MKFILIDKVVHIDSPNEIKAVKSVSLAEEYLGDHFPIFPVLPGVLDLFLSVLEEDGGTSCLPLGFCLMGLLREQSGLQYLELEPLSLHVCLRPHVRDDVDEPVKPLVERGIHDVIKLVEGHHAGMIDGLVLFRLELTIEFRQAARTFNWREQRGSRMLLNFRPEDLVHLRTFLLPH
ncbi:hypothetical protein LCGC14_3059650, partial [marine sediment metagenome]